jgi:hypothetical protein
LLVGVPSDGAEWKYGYLPALIAYVLLIVLELFLPTFGLNPSFLALLLGCYLFYLLLGSLKYGVTNWFTHAEIFTVFIGLASRLAPLRLTKEALTMQSPTQALVEEQPKHMTLLLFMLFALAATACDGFSETTAMEQLIINILGTPWTLTSMIVFAVFPLLFFLLYGLAIWLMKKLVSGQRTLSAYLLRFAYSLVPIILAHYFPLLFNSLGVVIDAGIVWYAQLFTIVLGHTYAAYIAHQIAQLEFPKRRHAILSQAPMMLLMVFYTAFGLWVLAQPYAGI